MLGRLVAARADLSAFRAILVGGAHLSPDLRANAERAGANVVETYGLTETCGGVVYDGVARRLVAAWKERGRRDLAVALAAVVVETVGRPAVETLTWLSPSWQAASSGWSRGRSSSLRE